MHISPYQFHYTCIYIVDLPKCMTLHTTVPAIMSWLEIPVDSDE